MRRIGYIAVFAGLIGPVTGFGATGALAQGKDVMPAMTIPGPDEKDGGIYKSEYGPSQSDKDLALRNPYLSDTLSLQYQISLLQQMISRQTQVSRMEKAYQGVGIPFSAPPPSEGICRQIPLNVPCYRAYPDLYKTGFTGAPLPKQEKVQPLPSMAEVPQISESMLRSYMQEENESHLLKWADISCAAGKCSAVLSTEDKSSKRRTVKEGDILPDGSKVEKISVDGVRISNGNKSVDLKPANAPSRGGPASPRSLYAAAEKVAPVKKAEPKPPGNKDNALPDDGSVIKAQTEIGRIPMDINPPDDAALGPTGLY